MFPYKKKLTLAPKFKDKTNEISLFFFSLFYKKIAKKITKIASLRRTAAIKSTSLVYSWFYYTSQLGKCQMRRPFQV